MKTQTLSLELLHKIDACYRAANYLSVGQRMCSPWRRTLEHDAGTEFDLFTFEPGHQKYDLDMFYIAGPGRGGTALVDMP